MRKLALTTSVGVGGNVNAKALAFALYRRTWYKNWLTIVGDHVGSQRYASFPIPLGPGPRRGRSLRHER
jgi:hypothetical protein